MVRSKRFYLFAILMVLPYLITYGQQLKVYTVNYPLQYMTQRISGESTKVILPIPQGIDPAFWNPRSEDIAEMQTADLIVLNGANYAQWLSKHSLPRTKLINSLKNNKTDLITSGEAVTHSHGSGGEHSHESLAFTTWLDFKLAQEQAKTIHKALLRKLPEQKNQLDTNLESLLNDLQTLHEEMDRMKEKWSEMELLASHPVYQYLSAAYQMNLTDLHLEPTSYPSKSQWSKIETMKNKGQYAYMIWEGQPLNDTVARLKKMGIEAIVFNPCANRPKTGDFLSVMKQNMENLAKVK